MDNSPRFGSRGWFAIPGTFLLSLFAMPTCTGFFFAIYFLPGLEYIPLGLIALASLVFGFILLGRTEGHESISEGLRDSIKLNLLLGILAWTFYFMPTFGPIFGKIIQAL